MLDAMSSGAASTLSLLETVLDNRGWHSALTERRGQPLSPARLDTALLVALDLAGLDGSEDLPRWREAVYDEGKRKLFPHRFARGGQDVEKVAEYFFPLAASVIEEQARQGGDAIAVRLPFVPLTDEEIRPWPSGKEYAELLGWLEKDGVLVTLAMSQQWFGYSIDDHVLGVTGLSLWVGRQLARSIPVDLPLLHGAAIGHDIGKFGCIRDEERRIPRLHYYYTHQWYEARKLPGLGHIATNHSCWDLEQIRLPIETQLLIYADFRVKDDLGPDGKPRMVVSSLQEAFDTIRNKLENLNDAKLRRYQGVYRKLRDLEDYVVTLGGALDPPSFATKPAPKPKLPKGLDIVGVMAGRARPDTAALAIGQEISTTSRLFATAHNIGVMERLRDVPALRSLLEEARSFEGWRDLRTYIGVLGEYSPALSMEQKGLALDFFFELLGHRDDDIRYHAANRIGDLLALGEDFWRKDLPEGVVPESGNWVLEQLERVLSLLDLAGNEPEEDMGPTEMVVYSIPVTLRRFIRRAEPEVRGHALSVICERFRARAGDRRPLVGLYVCEALEILLPYLPIEEKLTLAEVAQVWANHEVANTRLMAWRLLLGLAHDAKASPELLPGVRYAVESLVRRATRTALVAELALLEELAGLCGITRVAQRCRELREADRQPVRDVMLRNLKSRVGWVEKKVNCDFLVETTLTRVKEDAETGSLFANDVAIHMANLLKVSRVEGTRFHAGRCLIRLLDVLSVTQRNDLMVELLRSLQLDVEAVARYIPRFLGAVLASLPEQEFLEGLDDIEVNARRGGETLQRLLLQTVVWTLLSLPRTLLDDEVLRRLAGVLLGALSETRASTVHESFAQIAVLLERLTRGTQRDDRLPRLLRLVTKKLLTLVSHRRAEAGRFFLVASALNRLDRVMSSTGRRVRFRERPSVAFIPGTFDPFTNAHREVVSRVLGHADEVLVQVDDYSWNKHAQPRQLREELTWMALSSVPEAFPSPFAPPVNLANPDSLRALRRKVGRREVTLVVGTDVLEGASAYREPTGAIFDLPHLVVMRENHRSRGWEEKLGWFRARVQVAGIPPRMRSVSSSSLRSALDRREELELLCDPLVARTLQERQLYVNYPSKKEPVAPPGFSLAVTRGEAPLPASLRMRVGLHPVLTASGWARAKRELCVLSGRGSRRPLAALSWREVSAAALPVLLGDSRLALVREGGTLIGRGALVDAVGVQDGDDEGDLHAALFGRAMARWLDAGLLFALVGVREEQNAALWEALRSLGAGWLTEPSSEGLRWAAVRLTEPLVMVRDLEEALQPVWAASEQVREVIADGRRALARFFSERDPGSALLPVSELEAKREVAEWAKERIAEETPRRRWVVLGLGRQFSRDVIGQNPTLAVELERFMTWQGYEGGTHPSHGSPSLDLQLHTARELGSDAVLVVPFLESAEPVTKVHEAARAAGLSLREVLIGLTSAPVHASLHLQGIPHRCGAVIPHWRAVVRESTLAPYVGGWSVLGRGPLETGSLLPSLNDCLPYHHPHPLGKNAEAALDFSRLALAQTKRLFETIERIFRESEGRLLSLHDLGTVVRTPRCPPLPEGFQPPRRRVPSELLADDLDALARLHPERHDAHRSRWGEP